MIADKFEVLSEQNKYPDRKQPHAIFVLALDKYNREQRRINKEFEEALYKEYGVENNPKRQLCFSIAWSHGHSAGFSEVENYFIDFVELIK